MASSLPPDVLEFLMQQQNEERNNFHRQKPRPASTSSMGQVPSKAARGIQHQFPVKDSARKAGAVQRGGTFMKTAGAGVRASQALGRVANSPVTTGAALGLPIAMEGGEGLGRAAINMMDNASDYYADGLQPASASTPERDRRLARETRGINARLPDIPAEQPVAQPSGPRKGMGDMRLSEFEQLTPEQIIAQSGGPITFAVPQDMTSEAHGVEMAPGVVEPEYDVYAEAQSDIPPEMAQVLATDDRGSPPQVEEMKGSRGTLEALGQSRGKRPDPYVEKPKSFLRKTGDFFRSGSANPDLIKHQNALKAYQADNALTDRELLAAGWSEKDILSARPLNQGAKMSQFNDNVSTRGKMMANTIAGAEGQRRQGEQRKELLGLEHKNQLEVAKAKQPTKEMQQNELFNDFALKWPELVPGLLEQMGLSPDKAGLANISKGRAGDSGFLEKLAMIEALRGNRPKPQKSEEDESAQESSTNKDKNKNQKVIKDTSMLTR